MPGLIEKMIDTSYTFLMVAKQMHESCILKKNKVSSYSRFIASFFFSRAYEMFESFLILLKADRKVDCVILLRSLCNMAIDFGYVLDEDEKAKEVKAIKYLLAGDRAQKRLLEKNIDEFRKHYPGLDPRLDELTSNICTMEKILAKKFGVTDWRLPNISDRAKEVGGTALNYYNQIYTYYSIVEHHNYLFGQAYVDMDKCEPLERPEAIDKSIFFRRELILIMFRSLFLIILQGFNTEFRLKWNNKLNELSKKHDQEYEAIKEKDKKEGKNDRQGVKL